MEYLQTLFMAWLCYSHSHSCKFHDHAVNRQKSFETKNFICIYYLFMNLGILSSWYLVQTLFDFINMHIKIYIKALNQQFIEDMKSLQPSHKSSSSHRKWTKTLNFILFRHKRNEYHWLQSTINMMHCFHLPDQVTSKIPDMNQVSK